MWKLDLTLSYRIFARRDGNTVPRSVASSNRSFSQNGELANRPLASAPPSTKNTAAFLTPPSEGKEYFIDGRRVVQQRSSIMVVTVEGQVIPTVVPALSEEEDWRFAKESIKAKSKKAPAQSPKQETAWFDFLFGAIPEEANKNARDPTEEARARDAAGEAREANPAPEKPQAPKESIVTGMWNGFSSWLDPDQNKNKKAAENVDIVLAAREEKIAGDSSVQSSNPDSAFVGGGLDSVNLAVSEDRKDNENASLVSGASSTTASTQGKMFGDLDSLPSAQGDNMTQADSVNNFDLEDSTVGKNEATVVEEEAKQIKIPHQRNKDSLEKPNLGEMSLENKRQVLLQELHRTVSAYGQFDVRVAAIDAALGDLFDESNKGDQAIKMHRAAVDIYSTKLGDDHNRTMDAKIDLGRVLENAEKYDDAICLYHQVTMMRRAVHGEKHPSAADSQKLVASALQKKGQCELAIKEQKRALKIYRESLGDAHEKVAVTVDEIASLYKTLCDYEKAAAILEEVVKLKAATKGMKSKAVGDTLVALGSTYESAEDFAKAMKSLKKAYKIYTEIEGHSSKDATSTLDHIAQLYEAIGDNERASIAYLGVLRGRKIIFGEEDLKVAETYFKLGQALRHSGQHDKALKCMKEALPIFVSKGVEMHDVEMIAEVMHEMALMNKEKHRFSEATRIFKQELGVRRKIGQADFPMIARTLNHLGVTEYEMKNNNKSLKYLIEALTIYKDNAERSVECAEVLFNTGLVFEASRNKNRAMDAYNEAVRIFRENGYEDSHPHLLKAVSKIEKIQAQKNGRR